MRRGYLWLGEVGGVSGPLHHGQGAVAHARGDRAGLETEFVVELAGQCKGRDGDLADALAKPLLGAGAASTERLGEPPGVAAAGGEFCRILREIGEQWLGEPFVKERIGADGFDVVGQRVVVAPTVISLRGVFDAARRAEQHQPRDDRGVAQGHVQRDATPKGVPAQVSWRIEDLRDEIGALIERGPERRGITVARQVERPEFARLCQNGTEPGRGSTGLGEAVEPDEHGSLALTSDLEE